MNLNRILSKSFFAFSIISLFLNFTLSLKASAQSNLPGKGLEQYDFMYAGEAKVHNIYIIRKGKIDWSYTNPNSKGEISDAVLLKNGNILFAHQFGVSLLTPSKKIIWNFPAADGTEIHTAVPIGKKHVAFVVNGDPAKVMVMDYTTNKLVKEFNLQVGNPKGVHGQFRHARLTDRGTLLVAHMDMAKINEYDFSGKILSSIDVPRPWSVEPLENGNMMVCSVSSVMELNRKGETLWQVDTKSLTDYKVSSPQVAQKLSNGNILFNNWFNQWSAAEDPKNPTIQAIEITPDKKVVWALSSWQEPANLGPSTIIQLLKDTGKLEKRSFGSIK